jgi:hypothetical protein
MATRSFNEIQLALIQAKINRFESLSAQSPRFFRESWSIVISINRQICDPNVNKNLKVLKNEPDKYYYGEHRLPFDLFRLEKLFFIYTSRGWDVYIDDLDVNLFDIEDILDSVRLELDVLIDYLIAEYDLDVKRAAFSLKRSLDIDQPIATEPELHLLE